MPIPLPDDPCRDQLLAAEPTLWLNPSYRAGAISCAALPVRTEQVRQAIAFWDELAPLLKDCFPELAACQGRIASELIDFEPMRAGLGYADPAYGAILLKADNALPVAGSIKARGGIYEVCSFAKSLAVSSGLISAGDDLIRLREPVVQALFQQHTIAVGSTGNLGLSIGTIARALGFRAVVHMSSDAKAWKVDRLTKLGVEVVTHDADYSTAVDEARKAAEADTSIYFVDDERSRLLFFGYSAAAQELADQLRARQIQVTRDHPLFVYLPCGIGGAPGGVAYGLKAIFGDHVHCFFVEPAQSPAALVHMMSGSSELVSVYDVGLTNQTEADGMAVARMSKFVADVMREMLSGVFTVSDTQLILWLQSAWRQMNIRLEPSATAGFSGPGFIIGTPRGQDYLRGQGLTADLAQATHIIWATGGALVPEPQFQDFLAR